MEILKNDNELINEWDKFIRAVRKNPTIREVTKEAWKRCKDVGLKPEDLSFKVLNDADLKQKISDNSQLINIAKPYLDHLALSLTGIRYLITLTDKDAWVIDFRGNPEEFGGEDCGICLGASWNEKYVGNNGVGTSIAIGQPVMIYGMEHFRKSYGPFTCIGVPIKINGKIIGGIDVCVPNRYAHPARLNLTTACVRSIETTIENKSSSTFNESCDKNLYATSELIATAVHDLKNPLAVIRGLGQLGKLTSDKNKVNSYFDRVIKQADELNTMVVELLSIFKPQKISPAKAGPIIKEVLDEFAPECEANGIKLKMIDNYNKYIAISEPLFKRAIRNLIANAVQAMDNGGSIEVKLEQKEDFVIISITDTAGGIPEELKSNLFEPFTFRRNGGTGLGLFMVYHTITNTHNGSIWFKTKPGKGTTFFIKLSTATYTDCNDITRYKLV
ncbi:ATP-binding protein [Clostridium neuense]|uniref:histidine kinase n=1 Tax=Clostridium neuense TaxID=1728934 RepID=A0ABW8TCJ4_9CLOT